jgi:glc operon protein GlcG
MKRATVAFVIGGLFAAAPFSMSFAQAPYSKGLTIDMANKCIAAAHAEAKKNNWFMVVSVVDDGGNLVALGRMDNAQIASIKISIKKAKAANDFRRPTKVFQDRVKDDVSVLGLPGAITSEGGVPLMQDGKIIGAVGSSGGTAQQDGIAAKACADSIGK